MNGPSTVLLIATNSSVTSRSYVPRSRDGKMMLPLTKLCRIPLERPVGDDAAVYGLQVLRHSFLDSIYLSFVHGIVLARKASDFTAEKFCGLAAGRSRRRAQGLLIWLRHSFLLVAKASTPCQEIVSRHSEDLFKTDLYRS